MRSAPNVIRLEERVVPRHNLIKILRHNLLSPDISARHSIRKMLAEPSTYGDYAEEHSLIIASSTDPSRIVQHDFAKVWYGSNGPLFCPSCTEAYLLAQVYKIKEKMEKAGFNPEFLDLNGNLIEFEPCGHLYLPALRKMKAMGLEKEEYIIIGENGLASLQ